jgi:hypothetical protein
MLGSRNCAARRPSSTYTQPGWARYPSLDPKTLDEVAAVLGGLFAELSQEAPQLPVMAEACLLRGAGVSTARWQPRSIWDSTDCVYAPFVLLTTHLDEWTRKHCVTQRLLKTGVLKRKNLTLTRPGLPTQSSKSQDSAGSRLMPHLPWTSAIPLFTRPCICKADPAARGRQPPNTAGPCVQRESVVS